MAGHERDDAHPRRRQDVLAIAALDGGVALHAALHAVVDGRARELDVSADLLAEVPQLVLVLEEAVRPRSEVGRLRAADHLERRHLQHARIEPRLIGHDGRGFGLDHRARQHELEQLADAHRVARSCAIQHSIGASATFSTAAGRCLRGVRGQCPAPPQRTTRTSQGTTRRHSRLNVASRSVGVRRALLHVRPERLWLVALSLIMTPSSAAARRRTRPARGRWRTASTPMRTTSRSASLRHRRHLVLPARARGRPSRASARARHHAGRGPFRRRTPRSSRPRRGGSSKANAASISTTNTSWVELSSASSLDDTLRAFVEQEVRDDRHQRRLPHERGERRAQAAGVPHFLQPAPVLVGVEAVNHLVLADARPHGRQVLEAARRR